MHKTNHFISALLLLSILFPYDTDNKVEYPKIKMNDIKEGSLLKKSESAGYYNIIPNLHTNVHIDVKGMVSNTTVDQVFTNDSSEPIEAIYVFPLPANAAVNNVTMIINDRLIKGTVQEKVKAKKIYEKAKKEGKRASLVEQERPNIFTNSISNIMPGDTIMVRIQYVNEIAYNKGIFSFRHPMVVAPRYITGDAITGYSGTGWAFDTDIVPDASKITPPINKPNQRSKNSISLSVNLDIGLDVEKISSPSHNIIIDKKIEGLYHVNLNKNKVLPNKDFILEYSIKKGKEPKAALFVDSNNGEDYFMLMAIPPDENFNEANNMPKDMIFIIDVSGSMSGTSIEQAKSSLIYSINQLEEKDGFNIIPFQSTFTSLVSNTIQATPDNKKMAINYINALTAGGGTEAKPALKFAMDIPYDDNKIKMILFITDGSVGNSEELIQLTKKNLKNSRLFTIGIGSAPNSYLLEKISREGRGTFTYISNVSQISSKVEKLLKKVEAPVLTNIEFQLTDKNADIFPNPIPDLFMDEPLVVFGKVKNAKSIKAEFIGKNNNGYFKINLPINLDTSEKYPSVSAIWARKKIDHYMDEWYLGEKNAKEDIIDIALEHNLISKFTSFVAVEHKIVNPNIFASTVPVPIDMPEGWNYDKVFGEKYQVLKKPPIDPEIRSTMVSLPKTATNMPQYIIFGIILILISMVVFIIQNWRNVKEI